MTRPHSGADVYESIGVLSFGKPAHMLTPAPRLRALLAEAALQRVDLLWLTTPRDLHTIVAEVWSETGFICKHVALPEVVLVLDTPRRPADMAFAEMLGGRTVLIDDRGPDKLELAAALQRQDALARHVIPCAALTAATMRQTLLDWMARGEACVIKPANGERGSNIQFLLPGPGDRWTVHKDDIALPLDPAAAVDLICRRIAGRIDRRAFLVQRYVTTRSSDGRAFDLRVHVQRGATGAWGVTRSYARLGEAGFMLSNISRGGFQAPLLPALAPRRTRTPDAIADELHYLALTVAHTIEAHTARPLAELGVDFAIDPQDALWLIEANVHPETSLHEHERAIHMIGYAKHLAAARRHGPPRDAQAAA